MLTTVTDRNEQAHMYRRQLADLIKNFLAVFVSCDMCDMLLQLPTNIKITGMNLVLK